MDVAGVPHHLAARLRRLADGLLARAPGAELDVELFLERQRRVAAIRGPAAAEAHVRALERWLRAAVRVRGSGAGGG